MHRMHTGIKKFIIISIVVLLLLVPVFGQWWWRLYTEPFGLRGQIKYEIFLNQILKLIINSKL
jgi:hypothetical protein